MNSKDKFVGIIGTLRMNSSSFLAYPNEDNCLDDMWEMLLDRQVLLHNFGRLRFLMTIIGIYLWHKTQPSSEYTQSSEL